MKTALGGDLPSPRQCATLLKALADETRLCVLASLLEEEKCFIALVRELR